MKEIVSTLKNRILNNSVLARYEKQEEFRVKKISISQTVNHHPSVGR